VRHTITEPLAFKEHEPGAPLSLVAPARKMSLMVGALLGMIVLRERVGVGRRAGCLVLILGVVRLGAA
jgi:uncharacterized membrane protein